MCTHEMKWNELNKQKRGSATTGVFGACAREKESNNRVGRGHGLNRPPNRRASAKHNPKCIPQLHNPHHCSSSQHYHWLGQVLFTPTYLHISSSLYNLDNCTLMNVCYFLIYENKRIMVMDQGRIVEFDSPQQLLAKKDGIFASMAASSGIKLTEITRF